MGSRDRRRWVAAAVVIAGALATATPAAAAPVGLDVLSSRADLVSGGDALVRVSLSDPADAGALQVRLGDRDVTGQFARRANGEVEARLTGIPDRAVTLTAEVPGRHGARLRLVGHPNGGPLISGPQLQPWVCQAGAVDAQCNQPASYELKAVTGDGFVAYDPASPPEGVQETTTTEGETVPFIVRIETGYQDRDQYKIATLFDPAEEWEPWDPQKAWNGRVVFTHGGSCGTDRSAGSAPGVENQELLGKGFIVASTALNNLGHNCNPVIIAESELMARERVVEQHGPVRATIGTGCSGGAIAQLMVAHAYPGFYDGINTQCTFADLFTTGKHALNGHLFRTFFTTTGVSAGGGQVYTPADQALVNGSPVATLDDTVFDTAFWPAIDGSGGCGGLGAETPRWSPTQTDGVRCGVLDHNVSVLGQGPSGYAGIPFDNVGVQYGFKALEQGLLTPAKFTDLNARIGGLDKVTLEPKPGRTEADLPQVVNAYRAGYMAIGNTLNQTPLLEGRGSNEATAHVTYPTKVLDARLERFGGSTASHVLWQGPVPLLGGADFADRMVLAMDRWVAAIQADDGGGSQAEKVRRAKPADITDHCEYAGGVQRPGTDCPELVRYYDSPNQVAGESLRNDVLKCQLKPLREIDYNVSFTDAQWAQLQQTFPTGVCDWSKPGIGETETVPWLSFEDGPGGRPLGAAPASEAFALSGSGEGAPSGDRSGQPGAQTPAGQGTGSPAAGAPGATAPTSGAQGATAPTSGAQGAPAARKARLAARLLSRGRLRVACRLGGAPLRSCRVTVSVRRGARTRALRRLTLRPGRSATVRTGSARRIVVRASFVATDGRRVSVRRTLTRRAGR